MSHVKYGDAVVLKPKVSREVIEAETRGLQDRLSDIASTLKNESLGDYAGGIGRQWHHGREEPCSVCEPTRWSSRAMASSIRGSNTSPH
jgi:hypothetical protein